MVTIEADKEVWRFLQVRKNPGDSFNDVLRRELGLNDDKDEPKSQPEPAVNDDVDDLLKKWEPNTEVDHDRARKETMRAVAWLRKQPEPKRRSEIAAACAGESQLGERSWWERAVQPGLRYLANNGHVKYRPGYHDYQVVETES